MRNRKRNLTKAQRREVAALRNKLRNMPKNYSFLGVAIDSLRARLVG